jgi:glycosyltransferase involved in cell wall biosynthesis
MQPVSFFIPAYNCAATITEAIESIMETNFADGDELIITNDCSTDNTEGVLKELKNKYPEIILHKHILNKGGAAARNTSVERAKHDLLFCLDSDNVLAPSCIMGLRKYLAENNADVASFQHQHYFLEDKLKPEYIWSLPQGEVSLQSYLKGENTPGQHGNYLFTKQSWINAKGYAEGSGALDTWTFGLRQVITGAKMVVLKDTLYYHRLDYANSYWMNDAEANLWSVSMKATYALFPFFDSIDEGFLNYMLGSAKYDWFYKLKQNPIVLTDKEAKKAFYSKLHLKVKNVAYPGASFFSKVIYKLKSLMNIKQ